MFCPIKIIDFIVLLCMNYLIKNSLNVAQMELIRENLKFLSQVLLPKLKSLLFPPKQEEQEEEEDDDGAVTESLELTKAELEKLLNSSKATKLASFWLWLCHLISVWFVFFSFLFCFTLFPPLMPMLGCLVLSFPLLSEFISPHSSSIELIDTIEIAF